MYGSPHWAAEPEKIIIIMIIISGSVHLEASVWSLRAYEYFVL
jgi:hypothetical protein